jgi:lysophospholipase L1-like esterase
VEALKDRKMEKTISLLVASAFVIILIPGVAGAKIVACVGDSNTYGYGIFDRISNSYPAQLEIMLQQTDVEWEVRNFGYSGATVLKQGDISYFSLDTYQQALASNPDVALFCFGPNGSRSPNRGYIQESYVSDYIDLIDSFTALPSNPQIWICYPLKAFSNNWSIDDDIIRDQIIPLVAQVASEKHVDVIDFYSAFTGSPQLYIEDGIHANSSGAKLMAEMVAAALLASEKSPDFNGDGTVGIEDLLRLIGSWGKDDAMADIVPPPWGDDVVDASDLEVLMSHWGQPVDDPTLIAHWALDETDGMVASDGAGDNMGYASGNPVWQPDGGMVDGALQFDGIDDYVMTNFVLNPADGKFSVVAWVKGGAPGQVLMSQADGVNWLSTDSVNGCLTTQLKSGQSGTPLSSQACITDSAWHRIGFVWDGSQRRLYVDGLESAKDTEFLPPLDRTSGGLCLGTGSTQTAGSFFCGLIDDVRIYNRVVSP